MKIEFLSSSKEAELIVDPPVPAKKIISDWYKNTPRFLNDSGPIIENGEVTNNSIKACLPFYDAMTHGYIQQTWCDIHIDMKDGFVKYNFSCGPEIISHRDEVSMDIPDYLFPAEFSWKIPWMPKLPKGWSILITPPLNRLELPFVSPSGIIDSDSFYHVFYGNYPFYIKNNFSGIIPKGTPMYQMTPIKRESWNSTTLNLSDDERTKLTAKRNSYFFSPYKKMFYKKKFFK